MIKVIVSRNNKTIEKFTVTGHANYADDGRDIICAAVSAVVYTALGYFEEKYKRIDFTERDGYIEWNRPSLVVGKESDAVEVVLDTMIIGLKQIQLSYGSKYLTITDREVQS